MVVQGQSYRINITVLDEDGDPVNLTGATALEVGYLKPDGSTGYWTGVVDVAISGTLHYDVTPTNNDAFGIWTTWARVTFSPTNIVLTVAESINVLAPGQLA